MANELDSILRRYSDTETPVENLSSKSSNLDALRRASQQAKVAELESLYKPTEIPTETPHLITDPEAVRQARLAEIEATYRANPNRAIESAHAIDYLSPNFEMVGEPYAPKIDAPVPAIRAKAELPAIRAKAELPDIVVRGYSTETPMSRLMGRYPNAVMGAAGIAAAGVDRYLQTKDTNEPFFNSKGYVDQMDSDYQKIIDAKNGKYYYFSPEEQKPLGGGKMPSESDLLPLSEKIDLSKYMMTQPEIASRGEDYSDPTAANRKALSSFLIPDNSAFRKSAAEADAKAQAQREADLRTKEYNFANSPAVDSRMLEPFSDKVDLAKYFGKSEDSSNLTDMNAKLPSTKTTPSWSADAAKQSEQAKPNEAAQPKISKAQSKAIQANPTKAKEEAVAKVDEANKKLSEQDINTREYDDAIKQRNMNQFIATMAQAAERVGYSLAGGNAQVLKPDLAFTNKMMEQAGQPLIDLKERRKEREEQEANDPNSAKSRQFQDILISMHPELESKVRKMSYSNLDKQFPSIMNALNVREGIKARKESAAIQRATLEMRQDESRLDKHNTAITNDLRKVDDEHIKDTQAIENAIALANEAKLNPQAATNVVRSIVKAVEGGPSRVSDKDITTALAARGVSGELQAWFQKKMQGTMPKTQADDVIAMLYVMKDLRKKDHEARTNQVLELRARGQNRDIEKVKEQFIPGYGLNKEKELSKKSESSSTKGQDWRYKGP